MSNAEPKIEEDAGDGNGGNDDDGFLIDPEMDDNGWFLPINAPRDMDAELQWWLTS